MAEDGRRRSAAAQHRHSSGAFMHAHLALIPADGRRGSVLLPGGLPGPLPGLPGGSSALMAPIPALQVAHLDHDLLQKP